MTRFGTDLVKGYPQTTLAVFFDGASPEQAARAARYRRALHPARRDVLWRDLARYPDALSLFGLGRAAGGFAVVDRLGRLRIAMGGCQICIAFDPTAYLRFRVALMVAKDKAAAKQGKTSLAELKKVGTVGSAMVGFKVEPKQGAMGSVLPKELLFANKAAVATLKRINDLVDGGGSSSVVEAPPAPKKEPAPKKAPAKGKAG